MSYIVPQVLINQLISEVSLNTVKNQNVLVIGPNYELFRYSEADEKQKIGIGRWDDTVEVANPEVDQEGAEDPLAYVKIVDSTDYPVDTFKYDDGTKAHRLVEYPRLPANAVPDASYVKVFAEDVTLEMCNIPKEKFGGNLEFRESFRESGILTRIKFPFVLIGDVDQGRGNDPVGNDEMVELERDITVGDVVAIKYTVDGKEKLFISRISAIEKECCKNCDESKDSREYYYGVAVLEDAIPEEVYDTGNFVPYEYDESNEEGVLGHAGVSGAFDSISFCARLGSVEVPSKQHTNQEYNWYAFSNTEYDGIYGVEFNKDRLLVPYSNWLSIHELETAMADKSSETKDMYKVLSANLYVEYRALLKTTTTSIESIASSTKVANTLGTVHPDNPLAFGAYMALLNAGDRLVYYCGVDSDDLDGYNRVLSKAELTDEVYLIVPLTRDGAVIDAVKSHVERMSTAENKLWRIGFVSQTVPAYDEIYTKESNPNAVDYYAKVSRMKGGTSGNRQLRVLSFMQINSESLESDEAKPDKSVRAYDDLRQFDVVRVYTGNSADEWDDTPGYTEYVIDRVLSNNSVLLSKPLDINIHDDDYRATGINYEEDEQETLSETKLLKVEVYRVLEAGEQVKHIADLSSKLATRRMYNVFPQIAMGGGVSFGGEFLAAAAAGLVSSVLPQQPVTNVELNGVDDIPLVYQTYSKAQLDTIAAGGTFIVMQDRPGAKVYVRHQISTAYTDNNLLKAELSITKNLDSISYYFAEMFAPFIGKYNITPELIEVLRSKLNEGLAALETSTAAGLYGPQVLEEGTEILELYQHPVNRDHVYAKVHLNLPVPFNYFDLDLEI